MFLPTVGIWSLLLIKTFVDVDRENVVCHWERYVRWNDCFNRSIGIGYNPGTEKARNVLFSNG